MSMIKVGYFAGTHSGRISSIHIVNDSNKPVCYYKPKKTSRFYQVGGLPYCLKYVECQNCKDIYEREVTK